MSVLGEQEPTDPQDPLHYAPRRRVERSGIRLSTVSSAVDETKFDRSFRDASSSPFAPADAVGVGEALRRRLDPQVVPEPAAFAQERSRRRELLMVGGGIAAAVGVAAVVALLLVTVMPVSRDSGTGSSSTAAAGFAQPRGDDTAKPAPSQFRSLLVLDEGNQAVTHEQSERLLEQFVQWRQKADSAQH
jgi:hypothetical protein